MVGHVIFLEQLILFNKSYITVPFLSHLRINFKETNFQGKRCNFSAAILNSAIHEGGDWK